MATPTRVVFSGTGRDGVPPGRVVTRQPQASGLNSVPRSPGTPHKMSRCVGIAYIVTGGLVAVGGVVVASIFGIGVATLVYLFLPLLVAAVPAVATGVGFVIPDKGSSKDCGCYASMITGAVAFGSSIYFCLCALWCFTYFWALSAATCSVTNVACVYCILWCEPCTNSGPQATQQDMSVTNGSDGRITSQSNGAANPSGESIGVNPCDAPPDYVSVSDRPSDPPPDYVSVSDGPTDPPADYAYVSVSDGPSDPPPDSVIVMPDGRSDPPPDYVSVSDGPIDPPPDYVSVSDRPSDPPPDSVTVMPDGPSDPSLDSVTVMPDGPSDPPLDCVSVSDQPSDPPLDCVSVVC